MFKNTLLVIVFAGLIGSSVQAHNSFEIAATIQQNQNRKTHEKLYHKLNSLKWKQFDAALNHWIAAIMLSIAAFDAAFVAETDKVVTQKTFPYILAAGAAYGIYNCIASHKLGEKLAKLSDKVQKLIF